MPLSTVDNTAFDAALAAVPGPFGPLTRTGTDTDLDALPTMTLNSPVRYHVKSTINTAKDIYISYDELSDSQVRDSLLREAFGINALLYDLDAFFTQMNAVINGANFNPLTADESAWMYLLKAFAALPMLGIIIPHQAYDEIGGNRTPLVASFNTVNSSDVITFDNNSTGKYQYALIDWGDGTIEMTGNPDEVPAPTHDYNGVAAGNYTIRLVLIGPGGIKSDTEVVVIS